MRWCLALALAVSAAAQTGSISGVIRDAAGKPVADCRILATGGATRTAGDGGYSLNSLPAGMIQVTATSPDGTASSSVMLRAGDIVKNYDLELRPLASITISGRVIDSNGDPVPKMKVALRRREYRNGILTYFPSGDVQADEQGKYEIKGALPGESYLVETYPPRASDKDEQSVPSKVEARLLEIPHTFYPGTRFVEDAMGISLGSGESRSGVDIRIAKLPTYCIDGTIDESGHPARIQYTVQVEDSQGQVLRDVDSDVPASDGRFRNCHLFSATYRVSARSAVQNDHGQLGGASEVTIRDADVHDLRVTTQPLPPMNIEWVWDSEPPDPKPAMPRGTLEIRNLDNSTQTMFAAAAAERQSLSYLPPGDFSIQVRSMPVGYYVKDMLFNGISALRKPLVTWQTILSGARIRFVVGRDGGSIAGVAVDDSGNPLPNVNVVFIPEDVLNPGDLPEAISTTLTDQRGSFGSVTLRPGKYRVVATRSAIRPTPECMEKLWTARVGAYEVEVQPGAAAVAKLIPAPLQ